MAYSDGSSGATTFRAFAGSDCSSKRLMSTGVRRRRRLPSMSKKLAEGSDALVLDVKCGRGAFMIVVGADRIAANGDTANKIGTYTVAVLAKEHGIPFYVAAPWSTIDLATPDGAAIPIEERSSREVTHVGPTQVAPEGAKVRNPSFDVTPARYIAGIITERGIYRAPFDESLAAAAAQEAVAAP